MQRKTNLGFWFIHLLIYQLARAIEWLLFHHSIRWPVERKCYAQKAARYDNRYVIVMSYEKYVACISFDMTQVEIKNQIRGDVTVWMVSYLLKHDNYFRILLSICLLILCFCLLLICRYKEFRRPGGMHRRSITQCDRCLLESTREFCQGKPHHTEQTEKKYTQTTNYCIQRNGRANKKKNIWKNKSGFFSHFLNIAAMERRKFLEKKSIKNWSLTHRATATRV